MPRALQPGIATAACLCLALLVPYCGAGQCQGDAPSGCLLWLHNEQSSFEVATFSHDGAHIALGSRYESYGNNQGDVWVLNSADGTTVHHWRHGSDTKGVVRAAVFSPDDTLLATGADSTTLRVWDLQNDTVSSYLFDKGGGLRLDMLSPGSGIPQAASGVFGVGFTPTGVNVFGAAYDARGWDLGGTKYMQVGDEASHLSSFGASADGSVMASYQYNSSKKVVMTSTLDGTEIVGWQTTVGCSVITSFAFSPDATRLLYACSTNAFVADTITGKVLLKLNGHAGAINDCAYSPDGEHLATAGSDNTVRLWSAQEGKEVYHHDHHASVTCVNFASDGRVVSVAGDAWVWTYDPSVTRAPTSAPPTLPPHTPIPETAVPLSPWQLPPLQNASIGVAGPPEKALGIAALSGDAFTGTLYVYTTKKLFAIDVRNAKSPQHVSDYDVPYGDCRGLFDIKYINSTDAVLRCDNELFLVNYHADEPAHTDLGRADITAWEVVDNYVFVINGSALAVSQIQQNKLVHVITLDVNTGDARGLYAVRETFLLLAAPHQLTVFDITDRTFPLLLNVHTVDEDFSEVVVNGANAYVAAGQPPNVIAVYDVADPRAWGTHVVPASHTEISDGYFRLLTTEGDRLYLNDMKPRPPVLVEANLKNPVAPAAVLTAALQGVPSKWITRGPYVYVAYDAESGNYAVDSLLEVMSPSAAVPITPAPAKYQSLCACDVESIQGNDWICAPRNKTAANRRCQSTVESKLCDEGYVKCLHPSKENGYTHSPAQQDKEAHPGLHCDCGSYIPPANKDDSVLCWSEAQKMCQLPQSNGTCSEGTLCSVNKIVRVGMHMGQGAQVSLVEGALAALLRGPNGEQYKPDTVKIVTACPKSVCPDSKCPATLHQRITVGCVSFDSDAGHWKWPEDTVYVDFSIEMSEPDRSIALVNLLDLIDLSQLNLDAVSKSDRYVLDLLGVTEAFTVLRPIIRVVEEIWEDVIGWWSDHAVLIALCAGSVLLIGGVILVRRVRFSGMVNFTASRVRIKPGMEGSLRRHGKKKTRRLIEDEEMAIDGSGGSVTDLPLQDEPDTVSLCASHSSGSSSQEDIAI